MVALGIFQALLNGIGSILAWIYQVVGNFGVSIIILTLLIRIVLLPLGIKQIKSMGAMQAIQPKIKEIQKKYKGNKQKAQEETMKLYKEAGVNPLGGCLPLLLQFPILIAMYAVIRPPQLLTCDGGRSGAFMRSTTTTCRSTVSCSRTLCFTKDLNFLRPEPAVLGITVWVAGDGERIGSKARHPQHSHPQQ